MGLFEVREVRKCGRIEFRLLLMKDIVGRRPVTIISKSCAVFSAAAVASAWRFSNRVLACLTRLRLCFVSIKMLMHRSEFASTSMTPILGKGWYVCVVNSGGRVKSHPETRT